MPRARPFTRYDPSRWRALAELLERLEKRRASFSLAEAEELARRYRQATSALARARHRGDDPSAVAALNALALRGHALLYATPAPRNWRRHIAQRLPVVLVNTLPVQLFAWGLLLAGGLAGFLAVAASPESAAALVPEGMYPPELLQPLLEDQEARSMLLRHGRSGGFGEKSFFAGYLFTHNTQVGLLSFAAGVLLAVPSVLLQLYNGLLLGAFAGIFNRGAVSWEFWAWLLPHGVFELTGITLCAAAGITIGGALLRPGRRTRADALVAAGPDALMLVGVAVAMLFLAALAESFVRQSQWTTAARLVTSGLEAAVVLSLYVLPRRSAVVR